MNTAEFACLRRYLGLPVEWVAERLYVKPATIRRWEKADGNVTPFARVMMKGWVAQASKIVGRLTINIPEQGLDIKAAREDCDPEILNNMPAGWTQMVAARVAERTGCTIVWNDKPKEGNDET